MSPVLVVSPALINTFVLIFEVHVTVLLVVSVLPDLVVELD